MASRKLQKADREKLRRDRLNEQFAELGSTLDPDRPKNDKASILTDTIQMVKDLTTQINQLKSEYAALTEESKELTQEKNDLREEKASLKSDIEGLNTQYQQRLRAICPWAGMNPSVAMHPPSYPFPMPVPIATGPIPMHPSFMQPFPVAGNQNGAVPTSVSTYVPFMVPNGLVEQQPAAHQSQDAHPASRSLTSSRQDSRHNTLYQRESRSEQIDNSDDVATALELKTPGSTSEQDISPGQRKGKKASRKESSITDGSSSSRCSSSRSVQQAVSSNSVVGDTKTNELD